jgi:hypothetical protein
MNEPHKVEFIAAVNVDENGIVVGVQPALARFLGQPLRSLAQHLQRATGAYQQDDTDVPAR